jgi:hypothetical protein
MKNNSRGGKRTLAFHHKEMKKKLATKNTKNTKKTLAPDVDVPLPSLISFFVPFVLFVAKTSFVVKQSY